MSRPETLLWLAELQRRFGAVLRAPLSADDGRLFPDTARYPAGSCDDILPTPQLTAADRLGIYQRQYWMRLLNVLQAQYPLTTRLFGAWSFNHYASRFLQEEPPRDHDLGRCVEGFDAFLARELRSDPVCCAPVGPTLPRAALLEAAVIDSAYRVVFCAPDQPAWSLASTDEAALGAGRLQLSAAVRCVDEHWPLLELRATSNDADAERPVPLPERAARTRHWLVFRSERGVGHVQIAPAHARLIGLLSEHSVGEALALLQDECPETERERLPDSIHDFFALAARIGCFVGWSAA